MRGQSRRIACRLGESLDEDHDRQAVIDAARQGLFVAGLLLPMGGLEYSGAHRPCRYVPLFWRFQRPSKPPTVHIY